MAPPFGLILGSRSSRPKALEQANTWAAKASLIKDFKLNDEQATYILDMPLRRLTKMSKLELESEQKELKKIIADLTALLKSDENIRALISTELTAVAKSYATPRRTRIGA